MRRQAPAKSETIADALHSAAIHLLRGLRKEDAAARVSGPQLSALSVLIFGGPQTLSSLAKIEQVRLPTMSRLVTDMERGGLAGRTASTEDKRKATISATQKGRALLQEGRRRRLARLTRALEKLSAEERQILSRAAALMEILSEAPQRD